MPTQCLAVRPRAASSTSLHAAKPHATFQKYANRFSPTEGLQVSCNVSEVSAATLPINGRKLSAACPLAAVAEVDTRKVPGHIEGDLIKGAKNASAIGTLVERVSRMVALVKLDNASSGHVTDAFVKRLRSIPKFMRKSMTYDRGAEMSMHQLLTKRLDMPVYFCDPYSPWQRGTNENTNGLIRQYLPKGTDLSLITQQQLTEIEFKLNNRPRKVLGFRTPLEVFNELRILNKRGVALQP